MIRRTTRCRRLHPLKAERTEIKTLDKGINETHWMIIGNVVIEDFWEEHLLDA
jgi:hypothetical protein